MAGTDGRPWRLAAVGRFFAGGALFILVLAGCRSVTVNETDFLGTIYKPSRQVSSRLDIGAIRVWSLGASRAQAIDNARRQIEEELKVPRIRSLLRGMDAETFLSEVEALIERKPKGVVIGNLIYLRPGVYLPDLAFGWPHYAHEDLFLFAHEVLHVWQHQNRRLTGYSLVAVMREHLRSEDPYKYTIVPGRRFLSYRFEQQGQMMEDFAELRYFRQGEKEELEYRALRALIAQVFDPDEFLGAVRAVRDGARR